MAKYEIETDEDMEEAAALFGYDMQTIINQCVRRTLKKLVREARHKIICSNKLSIKELKTSAQNRNIEKN